MFVLKFNNMKRKKVLKIFILSIIFIIGWGVIWSWNITRTVRKNSSDSNMKNQHAIVKNLIVTETQEGKKYWEFYAKSGEYNSEHNEIQLNDIIGNFYDKKEEVIISFKSKKGNYDEKTKKVVLEGDILFVGKNQTQLYADKMVWQGKDEDILAQGNVQFIQENKITAKAKRAIFSSDLTIFKILDNTITKLYSDNETKKKYTQI